MLDNERHPATCGYPSSSLRGGRQCPGYAVVQRTKSHAAAVISEPLADCVVMPGVELAAVNLPATRFLGRSSFDEVAAKQPDLVLWQLADRVIASASVSVTVVMSAGKSCARGAHSPSCRLDADGDRDGLSITDAHKAAPFAWTRQASPGCASPSGHVWE
jgi:hypothetical protein